jgi:pimeloyl-ACP methyl ester carboxylesterase
MGYGPLQQELAMRRLALALLAASSLATATVATAAETAPPVAYRTVDVDGVHMFYREAGPKNAPVVLLLHGFPTSSVMFRELIPVLADRYHVVAPDLPGFGFTVAPPRGQFDYSFKHLAEVTDAFTQAAGLNRYAIYIFDYGAPVGLRLALLHPERVTALVSQNGNAYEAGLSDAWNPIRRYWKEPTEANRAALRDFLTPASVRWQYEHGEPDVEAVPPESYTLDSALLARPGQTDIQLDLFGDYGSNVALYPQFQAFLRERKPPTLAIWGKHDPFFLPAGAEAFRGDNPNAQVVLIDAGHFALASHGPQIAAAVRAFLDHAGLTPG